MLIVFKVDYVVKLETLLRFSGFELTVNLSFALFLHFSYSQASYGSERKSFFL